jgi:hypothetical protein
MWRHGILDIREGEDMKLSEELTWRGFTNQMTFADIEQVNEPRKFYFGVDPSGHGMQIGNLAAAMMVRHFVEHGYEAYVFTMLSAVFIGLAQEEHKEEHSAEKQQAH